MGSNKYRTSWPWRVAEQSILVDLTSATVKALLNLFADFKDLVLGYCREPKLIWKRLFFYTKKSGGWWLVQFGRLTLFFFVRMI